MNGDDVDMKLEPDLGHDRLVERLRERYQLDVDSLDFVPFGIDSWSYVARCRDGSQVFVKLTRPASFVSSQFPLMIALAERQIAVPRPMADRDGGVLNTVHGYGLQVLEYLEGRNLEEEDAWPDDLYGQVADLVAAVHGSTTAVRHLVQRRERYELPFLPPFAEILTAIEAGATLPAGDATVVKDLRTMIEPRSRGLRSAMSRLEDLCDAARAGRSDEVLCHTDIWGSNLLRSHDGTVYLLDWDGALLGPPEHDLFMFAGTEFFPAQRFGWFLDRYQETTGPTRLDAQTFGFYFYRRNLEDLASFVDSIATGQMESMGPEAMLRVIADLLAELPRLEGRIQHVAGVLATDSTGRSVRR